ncbi:MAG TPA: hypothetical protein VG895_02485 [Patescibacteria group bacterium]|nr:hypothetical protein [Patescibacteria group bacterium]
MPIEALVRLEDQRVDPTTYINFSRLSRVDHWYRRLASEAAFYTGTALGNLHSFQKSLDGDEQTEVTGRITLEVIGAYNKGLAMLGKKYVEEANQRCEFVMQYNTENHREFGTEFMQEVKSIYGSLISE